MDNNQIMQMTPKQKPMMLPKQKLNQPPIFLLLGFEIDPLTGSG